MPKSFIVEQSHSYNPDALFKCGMFYERHKIFSAMEECYVINIRTNYHVPSMVNLGLYYSKINDYKKMIDVLTHAVFKNNPFATLILYNHCTKFHKQRVMVNKFLAAGKKGNINAIYFIGKYYESLGAERLMIMFYTEAAIKKTFRCKLPVG